MARVEQRKLSREAYRALQNVVGPEWITEDRAAVEAHSYQHIFTNYISKLMEDPLAVPAAIILPETTEQVQAIVRICNRYKVPFAPMTNGQSASALNKPATLVIYLSRMDKVLNVDTENMAMTVQPYVDYTRVQAAAMRKSLWNGGSPYSGAICKMGSHIGSYGVWASGMKYGTLSRNIVSIRVVLPTGEILDTGSRAVAGAGDFFEYGPGPDLMGIFRSFLGSYGIITEATIKLHPWVGGSELPDEPEQRPSIPTYSNPKADKVQPPKRYRFVIVETEDLKGAVDLVYKLGQSGIGQGANIFGPRFNSSWCSATREQSMKRMEEGFWPDNIIHISLSGVASEEQLEYEEKVLEKIVGETPGAYIISEKHKPEVFEALSVFNLDLIRNSATFRIARDGCQMTASLGAGRIETAIQFRDWFNEVLQEVTTGPFDKPQHASVAYSSRDWAFLEEDWNPFITSIKNDMGQLTKVLRGATRVNMGNFFKGFGTAVGEPITSAVFDDYPQCIKLMRVFKKLLDPNMLCATGRLVLTEEEIKELPEATLGLVDHVRQEFNRPPLKETKAWEGS